MFDEDQRSSISWSASTPDLGNPPDISKYLEKFSPAALISDWMIAGGKGWISAEEFISFRLRFVNIISFQIILMIRSHSLDFAIRQFHVLDQYKILVRYFALEWKLGLLLNKQSSSTAGNTVSRECSSIIIVLPYILFFSATVGCSVGINPLPKVGEKLFLEILHNDFFTNVWLGRIKEFSRSSGYQQFGSMLLIGHYISGFTKHWFLSQWSKFLSELRAEQHLHRVESKLPLCRPFW